MWNHPERFKRIISMVALILALLMLLSSISVLF